MANASAHNNIEGWTGEEFTFVGEYDFTNDAGAQGTFSLGTFKHKTLVLDGRVWIEAACTSAGSATVIAGTSTKDDDAFLDATSGAVANLTVGTVHTETANANLVVAADETLDVTVATADLTAGKVKVIIRCIKVV